MEVEDMRTGRMEKAAGGVEKMDAAVWRSR